MAADLELPTSPCALTIAVCFSCSAFSTCAHERQASLTVLNRLMPIQSTPVGLSGLTEDCR